MSWDTQENEVVDLFDRFNRLANQVGGILGELADDVRPHVELAAALIERRDFDGAIAELKLALEKRRDHARALYLLGLAHSQRGRPGDAEEAKRALEQALSVREGYAEAHLALGDALRQGGEYEAAAENYRTALPLLSDTAARADVERRLGALYLETDQIDKAVRELRKSVSSNPEDAASQGLLGQALVKSAQRRAEPPGGPTFEAARQCLLRAARAEHPSPSILSALGTLLMQADQPADAEKALVRALKEAPELVSALLSLGKLRLQQGDVASAYEQGLRAYASLRGQPATAGGKPPSITPDTAQQRAEVHLLLARCHVKTSTIERALAAYDEALAELSTARAEIAAGPENTDALHRIDRCAAEIVHEALHVALLHDHVTHAVALAKHPNVPRSPDSLAALALSPGIAVAEADALITQALELGDTIEVRLAAAETELRRGQRAAAGAQLRRAAALDANDPRPRKRLGSLYEREREALPRELYGLLRRTHELLSGSPELSTLGPDASRIIELFDRPLLVTVMGEFNSGKSTFVNALLGEEVAPMGVTPTTATINLLKYGREQGARVVYRDGTSRHVAWAKVPALLRGLDPQEAARIQLVEVLYPLDVLQRVNVVDTPGLNSILPEHESTAREFIAQADAVVWLFTVDQAGKSSEREALSAIRAAGKQILGVLNKIDRLPQLSGGEGAAGDLTGSPALASILDHLRASDSGLVDLLEAIVPFSSREAMLGRKSGDADRMRRANLPALEQALEERFFQRAQAIKHSAARSRLLALLDRARAHIEGLISSPTRDNLEHDLRLLQADGLIFQRDLIPRERKLLLNDADSAHRAAARETLDFVRPRRWPFSEHQAAPADRDFLLTLLDEKFVAMAKASRERVLSDLRLATHDSEVEFVRLLDEQVYGRYRAFSRGYLRGGKVDDFFVRVLPKLELSEAAIGRALERDSPCAPEILEEELLTPLRAFFDTLQRERTARLRKAISDEELRCLDIEERLLFPLCALRDIVSDAVPPPAQPAA
jgi:tetratricopeptide (TPR) repeat protein/GTPase SAR1 family protein